VSAVRWKWLHSRTEKSERKLKNDEKAYGDIGEGDYRGEQTSGLEHAELKKVLFALQ
jgi:hypothetical protein